MSTLNKKLKKLIKTPKRFILDSFLLRRWFYRFNQVQKGLRLPYSRLSSGMFDDLTQRKKFASKNKGGNLTKLIFWGAASWKHSWICHYLPEYQIIFIRPNDEDQFFKELSFDINSVIGIWGMSETEKIAKYIHSHPCNILRVEDGFLRSVGLGSDRTLPLSLVIDDSGGIYYNCGLPSKIENMLNDIDFSCYEDELKTSEVLLNLLIESGLTKYNPVGITPFDVENKQKKVVLVVGQVAGDQSLNYGGAGECCIEEILNIALLENPDSMVMYKPHPDVLAGYRDGTSKAPVGVVLVKDDIAVDVLLSGIDHVYTMTSLLGLEALLRGKKVTVFGKPFYAGWGLTDDRQKLERRCRNLNLLQLFFVTYVVYPQFYVKTEEGKVADCLACMALLISLRREKQELLLSKKNYLIQNVPNILKTSFWPRIFKLNKLNVSAEENLLGQLTQANFFMDTQTDEYQLFLASIFLGRFASSDRNGEFYKIIIPQLRQSVLSKILLYANSQMRYQIHQLLKNEGKLEFSDEQFLLASLPSETVMSARVGRPEFIKKIKKKIDQGCLDEAHETVYKALLNGILDAELTTLLADILHLKFDFHTALDVLEVSNVLDYYWAYGRGYLKQAQNAIVCERPIVALDRMILACLKNFDFIGLFHEDSLVDFKKFFAGIPLEIAMVAIALEFPSKSVDIIGKILVKQGKANDALIFLDRYTPKGLLRKVDYAVAKSLALSYLGRGEEALTFIKESLSQYGSNKKLLTEAIRLATLLDNHSELLAFLSVVKRKKIDINEIYIRKAYSVLGDVYLMLRSFKNIKSTQKFAIYCGKDKYINSLDNVDRLDILLVVAYFGPGDEIRYTTVYPALLKSISCKQIKVTCDSRLYSLFCRSFPELHFVSVRRVRNLSSIKGGGCYSQLPSSELVRHLDNRGWEEVCESNKVILQLDLLSDLIKSYEDCVNVRLLIADDIKVEFWRKRLSVYREKNKMLVGINWQSSLVSYSRNQHYVSILEMLQFFELDEIQFVNLQYGDCKEDLDLVNSLYPGKLVSFDDVDLFDDFESVAAIMTNLDLVVAPPTTMLELAGALGVDTILMSNSAEANYRKSPLKEGLRDCWFDSIQIVEGFPIGNKHSMVSNVYDEVLKRLKKYRKENS